MWFGEKSPRIITLLDDHRQLLAARSVAFLPPRAPWGFVAASAACAGVCWFRSRMETGIKAYKPQACRGGVRVCVRTDERGEIAQGAFRIAPLSSHHQAEERNKFKRRLLNSPSHPLSPPKRTKCPSANSLKSRRSPSQPLTSSAGGFLPQPHSPQMNMRQMTRELQTRYDIQ